VNLTGGIGNNTLDASTYQTGRVVLNGGAGDDILLGGLGGDTLRGGAGNDILRGNGGNDTLEGGRGNDTYIFDQSSNQGSDTVTESAGEGYRDALVGAGLGGVVVNLFLASEQIIGPNLRLTLSPTGQVEISF
jgi:Ca2+-binding RTX toxin-like protein